jgi:hypothetical protein
MDVKQVWLLLALNSRIDYTPMRPVEGLALYALPSKVGEGFGKIR